MVNSTKWFDEAFHWLHSLKIFNCHENSSFGVISMLFPWINKASEKLKILQIFRISIVDIWQEIQQYLTKKFCQVYRNIRIIENCASTSRSFSSSLPILLIYLMKPWKNLTKVKISLSFWVHISLRNVTPKTNIHSQKYHLSRHFVFIFVSWEGIWWPYRNPFLRIKKWKFK